jgi:hypothetical protein
MMAMVVDTERSKEAGLRMPTEEEKGMPKQRGQKEDNKSDEGVEVAAWEVIAAQLHQVVDGIVSMDRHLCQVVDMLMVELVAFEMGRDRWRGNWSQLEVEEIVATTLNRVERLDRLIGIREEVRGKRRPTG